MCGTRKEMCNYNMSFASDCNLYADHLLQSASLTTLQILSIIFIQVSRNIAYKFGFSMEAKEIGNTCGKSYCWTEFKAWCELSMQLWIIRGAILTRICEISLQQASKTTRGPRHVLWQTDTRSSSVVTPLKPVTR